MIPKLLISYCIDVGGNQTIELVHIPAGTFLIFFSPTKRLMYLFFRRPFDEFSYNMFAPFPNGSFTRFGSDLYVCASELLEDKDTVFASNIVLERVLRFRIVRVLFRDRSRF